MIIPDKDYTLGRTAFVLFALEQMKWALVLVAFTIFISIFRDAVQAPFLTIATQVLTILSTMAVIVGALWSWWEYKNFTFSLQSFDLKMRSGIMEKREISIPYRQIQSVDIVRSLTHQMLGLSKLVMLTAGHEEANEKNLTEVVLEPIGRLFAEEVRNALQERIGVQIVRPEDSVAELDGETLK